MLGHRPFYHGHFKRYVTIFGTVFNDISIVRASKGGQEKTIKVPLSFVQKDKVLERFRQNPNLRESWNSAFPRMSFEMGIPTYAGYRKENSMNYTAKRLGNGKASSQFTPAPYDINFTLTVFANYFEDGLQVVEQILPFFQPEYTVAAKELPDLGIERDIHIVLNSVTLNDNVEGDFAEGRIIEWSLDFTLKGFFYGPVSDNEIITRVDANVLFNMDLNSDPSLTVTAKGDPKTLEITTEIKEF